MKADEIKKTIEKNNESYVCEIALESKHYIQAIKLFDDKVRFLYYNLETGKIEKNKEILKKLSDMFENKPNNIVYGILGKNEKSKLEEKSKKNKKLREWTKSFVAYALEDCESFTEVYGKNFARNRMKRLKSLEIINEEHSIIAGYQEDRKIVLNQAFYIDDLYNCEKIENPEIKDLIIHESIHLILRHFSNAKIRPTGMMQYVNKEIVKNYDENVEANGLVEVGRGLNEGLTEWIAEKSGYRRYENPYSILECIIKELEIAIGTKEVMQLGTGKGIEKILKMKKQESLAFILRADEIERNIVIWLEIKRDMERLTGNNEDIKKEIDGEIEEILLRNSKLKLEMEDIIFEKYMKNLFEREINTKETIPKSVMIKFFKLRELYMQENKYVNRFHGTAVSFIKDYGELYDKYCYYIIKNATENKNIRKSDFLHYLDELKIDKKAESPTREQKIIMGEFAQRLSKEKFKKIYEKMKWAYKRNTMEQIDEYLESELGIQFDPEEEIHAEKYLPKGFSALAKRKKKTFKEKIVDFFEKNHHTNADETPKAIEKIQDYQCRRSEWLNKGIVGQFEMPRKFENKIIGTLQDKNKEEK